MSEAAKVVCVTGASGYIASWLVKLLLQRGYTVNASVRDPNDPKKTEHLLSLDGAKERLHLFKANLLEEGAFDALIEGCEGVFHTASPVLFSHTDPQAEVIKPAVEGTLNVLRSCVKAPSVKRVVITSSIASVKYNRQPLTPDVVVDETWFSDCAFCKEQKVKSFYTVIREDYPLSDFLSRLKLHRITLELDSKIWYLVSKILAEEAAWKYAKENGIDLVTLHPGLVIGPLLQPTLNFSAEYVLDHITGAIFSSLSSLPAIFEYVDVRDVAYAHIQAFEVPSASGRYILVGDVKNIYEALKNVKEHYYPALSLPEKWESEKLHQVSKEKAKALGVTFIPMEVSLRDTIESLKEKGFLNM